MNIFSLSYDLRAQIEPSIKCTDSEYRNTLGLVVTLSAGVTLGFPFAYFLLLRMDHTKINPRVQGMFILLGQDMAKANTNLEAAKNADKNTKLKAAKNVEANTKLKAAKRASEFWADRLSMALKMNRRFPEFEEQLTSSNTAKCTELVERAYHVKQGLWGPACSITWLQQCMRAQDQEITRSKFLWSPYCPRYYWLELLEIVRKFVLTGLPSLVRLTCGEGTGIDVGLGTLASSVFAAFYTAIDPYENPFDLFAMQPTQYLITVTVACGIMKKYSGDLWITDMLITAMIVGFTTPILFFLIVRLLLPDLTDQCIRRALLWTFHRDYKATVKRLRETFECMSKESKSDHHADGFNVLRLGVKDVFSHPKSGPFGRRRAKDAAKLLLHHYNKPNEEAPEMMKKDAEDALKSMCRAVGVEVDELAALEAAWLQLQANHGKRDTSATQDEQSAGLGGELGQSADAVAAADTQAIDPSQAFGDAPPVNASMVIVIDATHAGHRNGRHRMGWDTENGVGTARRTPKRPLQKAATRAKKSVPSMDADAGGAVVRTRNLRTLV
jgi:hypothetical protein